MRCKEARTLLYEDVHMDAGYLDVKQSKGPKNRRIYISTELLEYLKKYESTISLLFPNRKYFFPSRDSCYGTGAISGNFRRIWKLAYPDFVLTSRPRAYDFRHHFAWANLNRWAAEGMDVNVMLPYLMRYMGHQSISETLYYFHFVPEFFPTYSDMSSETECIIPEVPYEER
jgi:integrase